MPTLSTPTLFFVVATLLAVLWDVVYGGRIAQLRRAPKPLATLSALCGFLVAPALIAGFAGASVLGGHAVAAVAWLWPVTTGLFVAQAAYATLRRYVTPLIGVPVLAYDTLLFAIAVAQWLLRWNGRAPTVLLALTAAQASLLGTLLGRAALAAPFLVQVPLLVPAYPARWRATKVVRALLAVGTTTLAGVLLLELPRGYGAVRSYQPYATERLSERPAGDFALGIKLLPTLTGLPSATMVRTALPLADTLDLDVVSLTLHPAALTLTSLDSLARLIDPIRRRDSTALIVAIGFDDDDRAALREGTDRFLTRRLGFVERVARALRPDVLLPATAPYGDDRRVLGEQPVELWRRYLTDAAARANRVNANIRVGVASARYDAADSALYAWAASRSSPLEAVGFVVAPSFNGGTGVDARLRTADRWMRLAAAAPDAPRRPKAHWVFDVRGYPMTHGDASQERTVWHTLSWATARAAVRGVIVAEPEDYLSTSGLRTASGRFRPVVSALGRAARGLDETASR